MLKSQRPLGLILVTKDDTPERILFMYPHVIDAPLDGADKEIQLDTNSILIESNKLVDGQKIFNSADDSDSGDAVSLAEKSSNEEINKISNSTVTTNNLRTTHKSENQTKSTTANYEHDEDQRKDEENAKIRNTWTSKLYKSIDDQMNENEINRHGGHFSSNNLRRDHNPIDGMQHNDSGRFNENELNKRREKKNRLPIKVIAAMLQPSDDSNGSGVPFEVKIEKLRYVCNPLHIRDSVQSIAVVFVLHASCTDQIVEAYQNLSRKLAIAIETENVRCGYLREEIQIIQPFLDRADDLEMDDYIDSPTPITNDGEAYVPYGDIEKNSTLARTLRQVYEDIFNFGIVDTFLNDCIHVGFCIDPYHSKNPNLMPMPIGDIENITKILQPYHTLLFFEDAVPGPDSNPYVLRFFEFYDLERSLNEISLYSKMPLQQVKAVAKHYIFWGCAKIFYPLCNTNVYSTLDSTITTKASCSAFRRIFGPEIGLGEILSSFHPAITLGQFLEEKSMYSTIKIRKQMLIFLLRNNYITQLHKFIFLVPPDSQAERFHTPLKDTELNTLSNRVKTQIRQFKQVDETVRNALLRISFDTIQAGMTEADYFWFLSTFISLYPFLNGDYHIEAIMYHRHLDRSAVVRILDLFSDTLVILSSQANIAVLHKDVIM